MQKSSAFAIIGASTAGAHAAVTLRKEGFDGRIILIGEEKEIPYARPPLSKQYLQGDYARERLFLWPEEFYSEQEIELQLGVAVRRVLPREQRLELDGGKQLSFDRLLIATGMSPRRLALAGSDFTNIYYLRTLADSDRIAGACTPGGRAVVIGGGFIGMEVAAILREIEVEVSIIHPEKMALSHAIGEEAGRILTEYHRREGVHFHPESMVSSIEGNGRAERVQLNSGERIECDNVIIGAGVIPRTEILEGTEIEVNKGIPVDEFCRTNADGVFAAGDVTSFHHPLIKRRIHIEHWDNARLQGISAANNMLDRHVPFSPAPFFWSDQYHVNLQYVGFPLPWNEVVYRGDVEEQDFTAFLLDGRRLVAAACFSRWRERRACEHIIKMGIELDPERLRDEDFDLDGLWKNDSEK